MAAAANPSLKHALSEAPAPDLNAGTADLDGKEAVERDARRWLARSVIARFAGRRGNEPYRLA